MRVPGVSPSKNHLPSQMIFLGTGLSTNSVEFVNRQTVRFLSKKLCFFFTQTKIARRRLFVRVPGHSTLTGSVPQLDIFVRKLQKYLNRASIPDESHNMAFCTQKTPFGVFSVRVPGIEPGTTRVSVECSTN